MSRNPILTRVELAPHDALLTKGSTDRGSDLSDRTVRVELLSDSTRGGEDGGVLMRMLAFAVDRKGRMELRDSDRVVYMGDGRHTPCGMAFVPLFAPILSAASVVELGMLDEPPEEGFVGVSWSTRGCVDLGIVACVLVFRIEVVFRDS
jgi:hypothetical protein